MTSTIIYEGNLRTVAKHLQSGTIIETDAPVDNQGKGERFSPTDLVATALGTCMLTIMGIKARDMNIKIEGTAVDITKIMVANPRRIGEIKVVIKLPKDLQIEENQKSILEKAALTCPVIESLHQNIVKDVTFEWPDKIS